MRANQTFNCPRERKCAEQSGEEREQVSGLPASESLCVVSLGISFKEVKHNLEGQGAEGQKAQRTRCAVMPSGVKPVRIF